MPAPGIRRTSPRIIALMATAGALVIGAILFALFWPSAPPLNARPRVDA